MNEHYNKWSKNYRHYIDPWYGKLRILFMSRGMIPPTKFEFYDHCYRNTRGYYDPAFDKKVPPIVLTPLYEEEISNGEKEYQYQYQE